MSVAENVKNKEKVVLVRYGELHLKGQNRGFFEKLLIADIKEKLTGLNCKLSTARGRYIVFANSGHDLSAEEDEIIARLKRVFGLHSISVALKIKSGIEAIADAAIFQMSGKSGTFKVETNRADKTFALNSVQVSQEIGGRILTASPNLAVDLHNPKIVLKIDIREDGFSFVFNDTIKCVGGMPLSSAGKGLLLLSGGIDSPVAGYLMAKRGLSITALHFHSYPYTSEKSKQKVKRLAQKLSQYTNKIKFLSVKVTDIQEQIQKHCDHNYSVILLRILMMKIAQTVAIQNDCKCIVNGESLAQVASQTLDSLVVTNSDISIPVFRPLIGHDKQEIIDIARQIDTFSTSIEPFDDCCTVFLPPHPVTKPSIEKANFQLSKIPNLDTLIEECIKSLEKEPIKPDTNL